MSPKKLSIRFCGPKSSCCFATVKNCLKQAFFTHFGRPGTIPSRPLRHKFGLELMMSPKKLSRRFCGSRSSCRVSTVKNCLKQACYAHLVEPGTIPSRPFRDKYGLELMMRPKKLSRRFCGPRSSCCFATVKNCLKQAFFTHFGRPGTIPSRPLRHKFCLELMMSPKKLSRRFCGPRSSCRVSTVKNCLKQACYAHLVDPGTIPSRPLRDKYGLELMMRPKKHSIRLCGPKSSGCVATVSNCLKQAFLPISACYHP